MKKLFILFLALGLFCLPAWAVTAQEKTPAQQPSAEELEKQKTERETNAYRLLDQVIDEAQSLRLVENRVRIQINAADMLWDKNQGRARGLFTMAGEGVAELGRSQANANNNRRQMMQDGNFTFQGPVGPPNFRNVQLRQDIIKQPGTLQDKFVYLIDYALNFQPTSQPANSQQEVQFNSDLTHDRSFIVDFRLNR